MTVDIDADDLSIALECMSIKTFSVVSHNSNGSKSNNGELYDVVHEGNFVRIFTIADSDRNFGSSTGLVAVKSLNE
eukprot:9558795-Ditylum_brightwellii.AAC.1